MHGRDRWLRWLAIVVMALALLTEAALAGRVGQRSVAPFQNFRVLAAWLDAVENHQLGRSDDALQQAARWTPNELDQLRVEINVLYLFLRKPGVEEITYIPDEGRERGTFSSPHQRPIYVFNRQALEHLRALALRVEAVGVTLATERGVMLHTDLVTLGLDVVVPADGATSTARASLRVFVDDGGLKGVSYSPIHWAIARLLAEQATANSEGERWVGDWYRATVAFLQRERQYGSDHIAHALRHLPSDARLLLMVGAQHEALASPAVQAFVETSPGRLKLPVQSANRELAAAERRLREALATESDLVEARVRLGRVLGLRGRHADAAAELRPAVRTVNEPLLDYYANLFLGAELTNLADDAGARTAFERASELYPRARSPHLALAHLAWRAADHGELVARLQRALATDEVADPEADPWFAYHAAHGRHADEWLRAVRETVGHDRR
jgi:tetratricopeptide (TPR) repeat protein